MVRMRFDRNAKFAVAAAYELASELRHDHVGTEHLLLGLAKAAPGVMPGGCTLDELRTRVVEQVPATTRSRRTGPGHRVYFTDRARSVVQHAEQMARAEGRGAVAAADVLSALAADRGGVAWTILQELGVEGGHEATDVAEEEGWHGTLELITVTDESEEPFYEQIAGRIREAVAHGRLIPGDRLPPVRRLAEALDLAPGTVAKAYRQLERDGVVETLGAQGTVVSPPRAAGAANVEQRIAQLADLLRPVAVAAFHMGSSADELFRALERAVVGVFSSGTGEAENSP